MSNLAGDIYANITKTTSSLNDIAMRSLRISHRTKMANDAFLDFVGEQNDSISQSLSEAIDQVEDMWRIVSELAVEHRKALEAVKKEAEEKIAAAQQSDCHPKYNNTIRKQVWDLTGGKCAYCDTDLAPEGNGSLSFVVEHVVPTSQGGPDNLANYVPACMSCNTSKGADHVLLFIQRRFPNRVQRPAPYVPERLE